MAVGIPVVASPVGVNVDLIHDSAGGFLAETIEEWKSYLELLIQDVGLRRELGYKGRDFVARHFSVASVLPMYVDLFRNL